jgi:peptidoglycan/xylan/chitin deacetylase (PgdA/CDA1 family)
MAVVRQVLRVGLAATLPRRMFMISGPAKSSAACLTFDDGPDPQHTPRLLDVLGNLGVTATFFVIGEKAERHPELVLRMVAENHVVGNHTYSHCLPTRTPTRQLIEEVHRTDRLIAGLVGRRTRLFRPPHGHLTASKLLSLWRASLTVVLWNIDPKDYSRTSSDEVNSWFRMHSLRGGDVVLLHDSKPHCLGALPALVEDARSRGLSFTTPLQWVR